MFNKNLFNSKKAFTIQFSWIFILIVGFLILMFVISVITKQREVSETDMNVELIQNIDSILNSALQSVGTFKTIHLASDTNIKYICQDKYSAYSVNNKLKQSPNLILFSPDTVQGSELFLWSQDYKMPMKISNILYLTNKKHKFIFVNSTTSNIIPKILEEIPANMTIIQLSQVSDLSSLTDENYDSYTVIVSETNAVISSITIPSAPGSSLRAKTNLINIKSDLNELDNGILEFYDILPNGHPDIANSNNISYVHRSMLFGAIFSHNFNLYNCSINKIMKKSETLYKIYNYTTSKELNLTDKVSCIPVYENSINYLENLITNSLLNNITQIKVSSINLRIKNEDLAKKSCPLIY